MITLECNIEIEEHTKRSDKNNKKSKKLQLLGEIREIRVFGIVAGVLQGDTSASFMFNFCLDYVLRTSIDLKKEIGFTLTKERSRRYPAQTITDVDYTDDIALLTNTPVPAESLLHLS